MRSKDQKKPQISALAKRFAAVGLQPARETFTPVIAVPTRFVQVDFATRVWGWPIQRCCVIHGPSNEGKSAFAMGLCASFVEAGGMAKYDDAERTTVPKWARTLIGETYDSERFIGAKPASYEECVDKSREFHRAVAAAREAGELPPHASAIQVVDSLRKLTPEDVLAKIKKEGAGGAKGSVDGFGGRAAQIRAALNSAWLDELVPLTDMCLTAWLAIARESENTDKEGMWDLDYKVQGGKGVVYDSALRCRIERKGWVTIPDGDKKKIVGERHQVSILKTKIGAKEGKATYAYFHTSNGEIAEAGFDRARDVAEIAIRFGLVETGSGGTIWNGQKWRSLEKFIAALQPAGGAASAEREELEAQVRAKFAEHDREDDVLAEAGNPPPEGE